MTLIKLKKIIDDLVEKGHGDYVVGIQMANIKYDVSIQSVGIKEEKREAVKHYVADEILFLTDGE